MITEELVGEWTGPPLGGGLPVSNEEFLENIRTNCKRDLPNLNLDYENDKIMVMVCGGPSAKLFLDDIRKKSKDDKYRVFCSNKTHDWLLENDIIPYAQFIIDPKKSKVDDVQNPHRDVLYMIGAQCNPSVFDALEGYNVMRILTYCGASEDGQDGTIKDNNIINAFFAKKDFTPLEGGTMAGLRAMPLANILGFRKVEFYGFDSCFFEKDDKGDPIYYSYDKKRKENILEAKTDDGKLFLTSPVFASQARQFIKWKHNLAWIDFVIHGDSLTAHINDLDNEELRPKHDRVISDYVLKLNKELHKSDETYGKVFAHQHAGAISVLAGQLIRSNGRDNTTLLDYGCGKGILSKAIPPITKLKIKEYDPCIEGKDAKPDPADIVVCTDVLEHIEPDCLENVLNDLQRVTKKVCYLQVCTQHADKHYADGTNTHLIQENFQWWYPKLRKRFNITETEHKPHHFVCVLQAKEVV